MNCHVCKKIIDQSKIYQIIISWWKQPDRVYEHNECSDTPYTYGWGRA